MFIRASPKEFMKKSLQGILSNLHFFSNKFASDTLSISRMIIKCYKRRFHNFTYSSSVHAHRTKFAATKIDTDTKTRAIVNYHKCQRWYSWSKSSRTLLLYNIINTKIDETVRYKSSYREVQCITRVREKSQTRKIE